MKSKYNLSPLRLLSRFFLLILVAVIFGIGMFPFLRTADGLLYEQRAAIGSENLWRIVILWTIYTCLFSVIAFWTKRFRMVSVFLIFFGILGTILVIFLQIYSYNTQISRCNRTNLYPIPKETSRALDLISQRLSIENNPGTYYARAFDYINCLNIQYSDEATEMNFEGAFVSNSSPDNMQILLNPLYKSFDDLTIATILIHELTHVGQEIYERENNKKIDCFESEADAFTAQSIFLNQLNEEERRSIFARLRENIDINPALAILLSVEIKTNESINSCTRLQEENSLSTEQYNECVWTGTHNKIKNQIMESEGYIEQCRLESEQR